MNYLNLRPQSVRFSHSIVSDVIVTNTGAPRGTGLSPFLFSLYTSDCRVTQNNRSIDKHADATVLTGMGENDDYTNYILEVKSFVGWRDVNHLVLNVSKNKEMMIDSREKAMQPDMTFIKDKEVERVDTFKYVHVAWCSDRQQTDVETKHRGRGKEN